VWADPGLTTWPAYLDAVATGYRAGVARVPLRSDPARAAGQIDRAIAAAPPTHRPAAQTHRPTAPATHGHIPRLLSPSSLRDTGWVLTDALYLNAAWAHPFEAAATMSQGFRTAGGREISARFMTGGTFPQALAAGLTAVSLPYRGDRLAMVAL